MTIKPPIYCDPRVQDLAEIFLADEPFTTVREHSDRIVALSEEIQQAIEHWLQLYPPPPEVK